MSDHTDFEAAYWGDCTNTFDEEQKHYVYARCMGLRQEGYSFDIAGSRVLDIGGGPVSMLLKCKNRGGGCVVADPLMLAYPSWVGERYDNVGIIGIDDRGEDLCSSAAPQLQGSPADADGYKSIVEATGFNPLDEVWIYNCLQHTDDPAKIIENAKALAPVLRLFEWIDIPPHEGHPHMLTQETLTKWIGQGGAVATFAESGCFGRAFFGCWTHK